MTEADIPATSGCERWLLLLHHLPARPAYLRVKIWRRLQGIGAVAVKNAVYALPANAQTQEDFEWVLKDIVENGGEAVICEARLVEGLSDAEVRSLFNAARAQDYAELAGDAGALADRLISVPVEAKARLARLKARMGEIAAIDFFGAEGKRTVEKLLADIGEALRERGSVAAAGRELDSLRGRVWVTRQGVQIDRIASSWLIRRFIDPLAQFKFVRGKNYVPQDGELRFDMFEAEFTHEGDRCTFEVLLARSGIVDPALEAMAEIIHDLDLKDGKFGREEAPGIRALITAIAAAHDRDEERIARGSAILGDLYLYLRTRHG